jgi:hypothetical protein
VPAFDLPFGGDGILDPVKGLAEDERYRPSQGCIAVKGTRIMFRNAPF